LRSWTNPADPGDPWADLAVFEDRLNLLIESPDVIVDLEHEGVQAGDGVRIINVSSSLGVARIFGMSRCARVAETASAIPRSSRSLRIWLISSVYPIIRPKGRYNTLNG